MKWILVVFVLFGCESFGPKKDADTASGNAAVPITKNKIKAKGGYSAGQEAAAKVLQSGGSKRQADLTAKLYSEGLADNESTELNQLQIQQRREQNAKVLQENQKLLTGASPEPTAESLPKSSH